jgi:two-component system, cell cycle response regulator
VIEFDDETQVGVATEDLSSAPAGRDRAYLIVLAGSNVGEMYKIAKEAISIGRGQGADLQILDEGISRHHAAIRLLGDEAVIEDTESRNGTFVNGQRVTRQVLKDGDKIQVGSTTILKFTYHDQLDESFQRQMYESALRDGLTKAFNKKYFLDRLESEFRFAKRHGTPLSLVMLDIDHFKKINDTYGHIAGDHVLAALARRIQETIRTEDVFARYGGEEFAVILRAIDSLHAMAMAERLRTVVTLLEIRVGQAQLALTISLGVAGFPDCNVPDPMTLIGVADAALYAAKRAGRNRAQAAVYDPPPVGR